MSERRCEPGYQLASEVMTDRVTRLMYMLHRRRTIVTELLSSVVFFGLL